MSASVVDLKFATVIGTVGQVQELLGLLQTMASAGVVDAKWFKMVLVDRPVDDERLRQILVNARIVTA